VLVALLFAAVVPSVHAVRKEQEAEGTEAEEAVVPSVHADDAEKIGAEEGSEQEAEGTEAEEAVVPSVHADDAEKIGAEEGSEQEAKAEEALKHLDTDGDGFVSLNEMLQDLGETDDPTMHPKITLIFTQVDKDGDGQLDVSELIALLKLMEEMEAELISQAESA